MTRWMRPRPSSFRRSTSRASWMASIHRRPVRRSQRSSRASSASFCQAWAIFRRAKHRRRWQPTLVKHFISARQRMAAPPVIRGRRWQDGAAVTFGPRSCSEKFILQAWPYLRCWSTAGLRPRRAVPARVVTALFRVLVRAQLPGSIHLADLLMLPGSQNRTGPYADSQHD
jgi:hypothetical protein